MSIQSDVLSEPFEERFIKWRVGSTNAKQLGCKPWDATKGIGLAYVDARVVMERLDKVVGSENWSDKYFETVSGRIICELTINGVTKSDGAGDTGTEGEKGAISDAFKRAAVKFGIGRYLYALPTTWFGLVNGKLPKNLELPEWAKPQKRISSMQSVLNNCESINTMNQLIEDDDLMGCKELWEEIEYPEQKSLWVAPTKGGVLSTKLRAAITAGFKD